MSNKAIGIVAYITIIGSILTAMISILVPLVLLLNLGLFILWVIGLLNAINEKREPIPVIGEFFEGKFGFING